MKVNPTPQISIKNAITQINQMGLRVKPISIYKTNQKQVLQLVAKNEATPVMMEFGNLKLLKTVTGNGKSLKSAYIDLLKKISNKNLYIDAFSFEKKQIKVPDFDKI